MEPEATGVLEKASSVSLTNPDQSIIMLETLVKKDFENDEVGTRCKEQALLDLGHLYSKHGKATELAELVKFSRPFLSQISKAKAARLVKALVDLFLDMEAATGSEVELCKECIDWAKDEKRTFLRQALECRLIALHYDLGQYQQAIKLGSTLLYELKKLDDKALLVEVQLLESKVYHSLSNLPKAKAALTSARTTANGIYCPPKLQAALDLQSGILHAAAERDFKTAFSYFYEAFEGYNSIDSPRAIVGLKYMLLAKIMLEKADEVTQIMSGKLALKYMGRNAEAMKSIAQASKDRSLADFKTTLQKYKEELENDRVIKAHLESLYDKLLEGNLLRIIEPYSHVQVPHVAKLIDLDKEQVEKKLSQMILDKKFNGILDQGDGVLIVFDETSKDRTYESAIDTIQSMGKVVDSLYDKVKKLT